MIWMKVYKHHQFLYVDRSGKYIYIFSTNTRPAHDESQKNTDFCCQNNDLQLIGCCCCQ